MNHALVIAGGGSKGAFSVGVIKDLISTYHLSFDSIIGTSTGALIAPLAAVGDLDTLETLYTTVTTDKIIVKFNLADRINQSSIFSTAPLTTLIQQYYTDDFYNRLIHSPTAIYLNSVCLQSGELNVFTTAQNPVQGSYYKTVKLTSADHFRRAILASASQPVFMPPVKVNKNVPGEPHPQRQFVDGGVKEYAGIGIAVDTGATEIFALLHSAKNQETDESVYTTLFPILQQTLDLFMEDVAINDLLLPSNYDSALAYIAGVKKKMSNAGISDADIKKYFSAGNNNPYEDKLPFKLHVIQPDNPLGGGPGGLDFIPADMRVMLTKGSQALEAYVMALPPGDVEWA